MPPCNAVTTYTQISVKCRLRCSGLKYLNEFGVVNMLKQLMYWIGQSVVWIYGKFNGYCFYRFHKVVSVDEFLWLSGENVAQKVAK